MSWSNEELSAYLDGHLSEARRVALEQALTHDAALRARLESLEHTVKLVRAAPLREVPRNFLLTPSMVAEPKRASLARRWYPITRLATALTAVALVITLGLQTWPAMLPAAAPVGDAWTEPAGAPKTMAPLPNLTAESGGGITTLAIPESTPTAGVPQRTAPPDVLEPQPELAITDTMTRGLTTAPQAAVTTEPSAELPPEQPIIFPDTWLGALSTVLVVLTLTFGGVTLWLSKQR